MTTTLFYKCIFQLPLHGPRPLYRRPHSPLAPRCHEMGPKATLGLLTAHAPETRRVAPTRGNVAVWLVGAPTAGRRNTDKRVHGDVPKLRVRERIYAREYCCMICCGEDCTRPESIFRRTFQCPPRHPLDRPAPRRPLKRARGGAFSRTSS